MANSIPSGYEGAGEVGVYPPPPNMVSMYMNYMDNS